MQNKKLRINKRKLSGNNSVFSGKWTYQHMRRRDSTCQQIWAVESMQTKLQIFLVWQNKYHQPITAPGKYTWTQQKTALQYLIEVSKTSYQGQRRKSWTLQIFVLLSGCQYVSIQAIQYSLCKHKKFIMHISKTFLFWTNRYWHLIFSLESYLHWNWCPVGCPKKWIKQETNALTRMFHT